MIAIIVFLILLVVGLGILWYETKKALVYPDDI